MPPLIIGICGGSGSGKSTIARNLARALQPASVASIDMDAYYRNFAHLPMDVRRTINWDHPDVFDWELLLDHLGQLRAGTTIEKPVYDFVTHTRREQPVSVPSAELIVVDGILLFADARARDLCDVKVFVEADADIRLIRRIQRDMARRGRPLDEILHQYLSSVQPMHLQFVEPSKRYADVIVRGGGQHPSAVQRIVTAIQRRLTSPATIVPE